MLREIWPSRCTDRKAVYPVVEQRLPGKPVNEALDSERDLAIHPFLGCRPSRLTTIRPHILDLDRLRSQIPAASSVQAQAGAAGIIKYLEDIVVGETVALGSVLIDQHDLVSFARQFDPQPFHTDPEAAAHTMSQGLIASGWHTCALAMRLLCDAAPFGSHPILGTGVDELRWPNPVRPGDVVSGTIEFLEVRPSGSKPDRGTARLRLTLHNQRGETVLAMLPRVVLMRRPAVTEEATDQAASTRCP